MKTKEKNYIAKVEYEPSNLLQGISFAMVGGFILIYFLTNINSLDMLMGQDLGGNSIWLSSLIGFAVMIFGSVWIIITSIKEIHSYIKWEDTGELPIKEIRFAGRLKEVMEVIYPKERKMEKTKYKTFFGGK